MENKKEVDLWVLDNTHSPKPWILDICQELTRRAIPFRLVPLLKLVLGIKDRKAVLYLDGEKCDEKELPKVAFVHMPNSYFALRLVTAIRHLEVVGVRCVNSSKAFSITTSKYDQLQLLATTDVKVADFLTYPTQIREGMTNMLRIPDVIHFPAILKHVHGNSGNRVMLVENKEVAEDLAENLFDDGMYLLQHYVSECRAIHYRVMVAGERVIGSFKYDNSVSTRVQSNLRQGGSRDEFECSQDLEELSVRIAKVLGVDIAGIDFVKDKRGDFVFLEANGSAGVSKDLGIMNRIIDYLLECCQQSKGTGSISGKKERQGFI